MVSLIEHNCKVDNYQCLLCFCQQDPFPLEAVCGHVWRNKEGQLSFLKHAIVADADVFTFGHSTWKLVGCSDLFTLTLLGISSSPTAPLSCN